MTQDKPKLKVVAHVKLEKFDGDKVEGQEPVEVVEFDTDLDSPELEALLRKGE